MAADTIARLIRYIKELGLPVLTEHVGADDPVGAFAAKIGTSKETLRALDVERQDIAWLDQATHVVAEISGPSTGTGREIEYARTKGFFDKVPAQILVLYHREREYFASPMISGMTPERYPNVIIRSYATLQEAKDLIREFLGRSQP